MKISRIQFFLNAKGQTAIEYVLLVAVSFSIGVTFKNKMEEFLLKNPNSIITKQLNGFTSLLEQDPKFRTFPLRKF